AIGAQTGQPVRPVVDERPPERHRQREQDRLGEQGPAGPGQKGFALAPHRPFPEGNTGCFHKGGRRSVLFLERVAGRRAGASASLKVFSFFRALRGSDHSGLGPSCGGNVGFSLRFFSASSSSTGSLKCSSARSLRSMDPDQRATRAATSLFSPSPA